MNAPHPDVLPLPALPRLAQSRLAKLLCAQRRMVLGLVGPPGSGKSTLARQLFECCAGAAQLVPMDGFHLANVELKRLGRADRKGAPDTFDSAGYVELLRRVRQQAEADAALLYAPIFDRRLEEPVAGAIPIHANTRLIITEGNYLLHDQGGWAAVATLLDETWYVDGDDVLRRERLVQRHVRFGRSLEQARDWVARTDEANARLVAGTRHRADWVFRWDGA